MTVVPATCEFGVLGLSPRVIILTRSLPNRCQQTAGIQIDSVRWSAMTTVIATTTTVIATVIAGTTVIATVIAKPTMIAKPTTIAAKSVVAMPAVPVVAPTWVPKIAWAPLRERPGLGLRLSCGAHSYQSQTNGYCENCFSQTKINFHSLNMYPLNHYRTQGHERVS
jgi:hypothetical protein